MRGESLSELLHSALVIVPDVWCGVTAKEEPEGFGAGWQKQDVIVALQKNDQLVLEV